MAGGMRDNSRLPKKGAGRPPGSKNGVRRPGIKGGNPNRRFPGDLAEDPLHVPGSGLRNQMIGQPEYLSIEDVISGSRMVQEILTSAEWEERIQATLSALAAKAEKGDYKAAELLLAYRYGKPIALNANTNVEVSAEEVSRLAAQVREMNG